MRRVLAFCVSVPASRNNDNKVRINQSFTFIGLLIDLKHPVGNSPTAIMQVFRLS